MSLRSLLPPGTTCSGPLVVSVLACGIAAVMLFEEIWLVGRGLLAPPASETRVGFSEALLKHDELAEVSAKRFTGRSFFTMPPAPVRVAPPPPVPIRDPEPPPPPPPPLIPAEYAGPAPSGIIGNHVIFTNGDTIEVNGEKSGIKVIAIEPPYSVRLAFGGGEYSVPLWTKTDLEKLAERSLSAIPLGMTPAGKSAPGTDGGGGANSSAVTPEPRVSQPAGSASRTPVIPPPVSKEQVDAMSRRESQMALAAVSRAQQASGLDEATRTRLNQEFDWLIARVRDADK